MPTACGSNPLPRSSSNRLSAAKPSLRAAWALAALLLPLSLTGQITDPDPLIARGQRFVQLMDAGRFGDAAALYDNAMAAAMPEDKLRQTWERLLQRMGAFRSIETASVAETGPYFQVNLNSRFAAGQLNIRVVLDRESRVSGLWFLPAQPPAYEPPDYVDRSLFSEEEVAFGLEDWRLPATLSIPRGGADLPAVVLVHGSGPNDRDETIGPNRPFRDLAWGLATRGILVMRYDKRTRVHGTKMTAGAITVEDEVIVDALAAVDHLADVPRVDSDNLFVIGHSLGAMLAPEIAVRSGRLKGIVLLAAPARPMEIVLSEQLKYIYTLPESGAATRSGELDSLLQAIDRLSAGRLAPDAPLLGAPASYYYDLRRRDQKAFAQQFRGAILVLQGGRDYQVTLEDYQLWRELLASHPAASFSSYANLNHLFMAGNGPATPQEYLRQTGNVAVGVIDDIHQWLRRSAEKP